MELTVRLQDQVQFYLPYHKSKLVSVVFTIHTVYVYSVKENVGVNQRTRAMSCDKLSYCICISGANEPLQQGYKITLCNQH